MADKKNKSQSFNISRFDGETAILINSQQEEISWPKSDLPEQSKAGDNITLLVKKDESQSQDQEKTAKTILNEVFSDNED